MPSPDGTFMDRNIPIPYDNTSVPDKPPESDEEVTGEPVMIYDMVPPFCRSGSVLNVVSVLGLSFLRLSALMRMKIESA